jgi:hypothetical protein
MDISKPSLKIRGWGVVARAVVALAASFCFYLKGHRYLQSATRARGTIVGMEGRSGRGTGMVYYPVFTFTDLKGQAREIDLSFGEYTPSRHYNVGDTVTVIYQPGQPESAKLYNFFDFWGSAAVLGGCGSVGLVVGVGMLVGALIIQRTKHESTPVHAT